jgi:hypothetical protein
MLDYQRVLGRAIALQAAHDALKLDSHEDVLVSSVAAARDRVAAACRATAQALTTAASSGSRDPVATSAARDVTEDFTSVWVAVVDGLPRTLASLASAWGAAAAKRQQYPTAAAELPPFIWLAWAAAIALVAPIAVEVATDEAATSVGDGPSNDPASALRVDRIATACARAASALLRRATGGAVRDELQEAAAATCAAGRPQRFAMRLRATLKLWLHDAAVDPATTAAVLLDGALASALAPTARRALDGAASGAPVAPTFLAGTLAIAATVDDCLAETQVLSGWAALAPQLAATCETLRRCAAQATCA